MRTHEFDIRQLHKLIGGKITPDEGLMVCNNLALKQLSENRLLSASIAAVMLCTRGSYNINVNMLTHKLVEGSVLMYGNNSIVQLTDISDDAEMSLIVFKQEFIQDTMINMKSVLPIFKYIAENTGELLTLEKSELSILTKLYDLIGDMTDFGKKEIVRDMLATTVKTLGEIYQRRLTEGLVARTRQEEYFQKFIKEVTTHYKVERSVKFYADMLHITPKYLSTIIKEISGKSAASWINAFVVQQSKIMLKYTTKSIQEITYELNFSTQSFFGKYFKRHTGMSPSEYRLLE